MKLKITIFLLCALFARHFAVGHQQMSEFRPYAEMSTIDCAKSRTAASIVSEAQEEQYMKNFRQSENNELREWSYVHPKSPCDFVGYRLSTRWTQSRAARVPIGLKK